MTTDAGEDEPPRMSGRAFDPRLIRYATASRVFFVISAAIVLAQTGIIVAFAWLLSQGVVRAIAGDPVEQLWPLIGMAAGLVLLRGLLIAASERNAAVGAARVSLQLRSAMVTAIDRLGPGWLAQRNAATLAATAGHGLETLDAYFGRYLPQLVATIIVTPIIIGAITLTDPLSGITVILTIPLIPIFMILIGLATRAVQRKQFRTLGRLAARFADTVNGLGTLKLFGREHRAATSIETVTKEYKRETMGVLRVSFLSGFALEFLASISVAIIAVTIGFRLLAGEMDLSVGLFVLLLAPEAYLPLRQVGVQFHAASEGVAATDDILEVIEAGAELPDVDEHPDSAQDAAAASPPTGAGRSSAPLIETSDLRVLREGAVLDEVSFAVRPGEVVLLTGPSGSGKSSVVAALLGFASFDGAIRVDGALVPHARTQIAWAGQRPGLIAGSVLENVQLGDPSPDRAVAVDALTRAQLTVADGAGSTAVADGAGSLGGEDTIDPSLVLGALGSGMSGGQAQRVAVARALYRLARTPARVLALDEPSSALDAETEAGLWREVRATADAGAGVLLISHRRSAEAIADRIVRIAAPRDVSAPTPLDEESVPETSGANT